MERHCRLDTLLGAAPMNFGKPKKAVILIIDNDPLTLTGVAAVLDMSGYECHCARDPEAALKAARRESLDLIISDVNLGGESGLELCRDLRSEERRVGKECRSRRSPYHIQKTKE